MVKWKDGEFYETNISKKKLEIIKNDQEINIEEFHDELRKIINECKIDKFDELKDTVLPLAKFFTTSVDEMHGFIMGFLAGAKCEREDIKIKIHKLNMSEEERIEINLVDMGIMPPIDNFE